MMIKTVINQSILHIYLAELAAVAAAAALGRAAASEQQLNNLISISARSKAGAQINHVGL